MATFDFEGEPITVLTSQDLQLGDLEYIAEHFGITGTVALEVGMAGHEPAAWRAILITSIRRVHPDVDPFHEGIGSVATLPLNIAMNEERDEAAAAGGAAVGASVTVEGGRPKKKRAARDGRS